jgi:hypothetical protein
MTHPANRTVKILLTLVVAACFGALGLSKQFYSEALVDGFFAFALLGVVILHLRVRPDWRDALAILVLTAVLAGIDFGVLHYPQKLVAWLSFAGVSSFMVMGARAIWTADRAVRKMLLYASVPALLFVASDYFASTMLEWTSAAHPKTLDLYLLSFDYSLGVELASIAGRWYAQNSWIHIPSLIVYVGLAIPITVVYAGRLVRHKETALPAMLAFLVTGPIGILFYNLFPACGPHALFQNGFPFQPFPMAQAARLLLEPLALAGPRNAIPSLHMGWALLAWWYSRGLSVTERGIALVFLVVTAFATLGTGEHWFVDLIVAFPFALMIQGLCSYTLSWKDSQRLGAFAFGLFATLGWLGMLRYGAKIFWTSPVVPWALAAGTIALTIIRQMKLDQAAEPVEGQEQQPQQNERVSASQVSVSAN